MNSKKNKLQECLFSQNFYTIEYLFNKEFSINNLTEFPICIIVNKVDKEIEREIKIVMEI